MLLLITICGALGAWFLVAGPAYQGALELQEERVDQEYMKGVVSSVAPPEKFSPLWWFLPPVAWIKNQRRSQNYRRAVLDALGPEELRQTVSFLNKARGWFTVAFGAFLIAFKETFELCELLHWPAWVFWSLIVLGLLLSIGNAVGSVARSDSSRAQSAALKTGASEAGE